LELGFSPQHLFADFFKPEGWGYAELEFWLSGGNMCPQVFSMNTGVIGKHLYEVRFNSSLQAGVMDESNKQGFSPKYKDICTPMKNYYYSRAYNTWRFARDSGH
jgi:hypothetical protein